MIKRICSLVLLVSTIQAASWPPSGEAVKAPVTRDTWVSCVGEEINGNMGGEDKLKTKTVQEITIVDLDPKQLAGRVILGGSLHVKFKNVNDVDRPQLRLAVSTLASDWVEGTSTNYLSQAGSSSFNWAEQDKKPWAFPGSDFIYVMCGGGNTFYRVCESTPRDKDGWQMVAIDPLVLAARAAGISHGFVLMDEVGNEYTYDGNKFEYIRQPNRFVHSRESGAENAPYFTLYLGEKDSSAPDAVSAITSKVEQLPLGESLVSWMTPSDQGKAGTVGFNVRMTRDGSQNWDTAAEVPRYLIPMAGAAGQTVTMHLRDLSLQANEPLNLGIQAVDGAGNAGPATWQKIQVSSISDKFEFKEGPKPFADSGELPKLGDISVAVIDAMDKVDHATGKLLPEQPDAYLKANHLWSASQKLIRLYAAKNEFTDFQIVLNGRATGIKAELSFPDQGKNSPQTELFVFEHVLAKVSKEKAPEILVSLKKPFNIPSDKEDIADQKYAALIADVYVPHSASAGVQKGKLTLTQGGNSLVLDVELNVWDFTLPDHLSFIPEMNAYGVPGNFVDYFRMAHKHRTCLNHLPYSQNGSTDAGWAPDYKGGAFNWASYDKSVGSLLDGTAFNDLPRKGVPVDVFYLPFNETWPMNLNQHFKVSYWPELALSDAYRKEFVDSSQSFAKHIAEKGWKDTIFELYLNNKIVGKKKKGWSGASAPWVFDEPASMQDFWALRWYGIAFLDGVSSFQNQIKIGLRADISRPQWQRDLLDGILDVDVIGAPFRKYSRLIQDRKQAHGQLVYSYGSANELNRANTQPAGWCLDSWCLGGDGVLPWSSLGDAGSGERLFYAGSGNEVNPSARLKSFRRGEQDIEYLTLLSQVSKTPRWVIAKNAREALKLADAQVIKRNEDDAGRIEFTASSPVTFWTLRTQVGQMLSAAKPPPAKKLVDLRAPQRQANMPYSKYVTVSPEAPKK
jgi:hypothetical protein